MIKPRRRTMLQGAKAARIAGVPLVAVSCFDPGETAKALAKGFAEGSVPLMDYAIRHDALRGCKAVEFDGGEAFSKKATEVMASADMAGMKNAVELMDMLSVVKGEGALPANGCFFFVNGHRLLDPNDQEADKIVAALYAARDVLKAKGSTLFLLGHSHTLPPELANDFLMMDEELPDDGELTAIIQKTYAAAKEDWPALPELEASLVAKAVDAVRGLPRFASEQTISLSIKQKGLDLAEAWARKLQTISQTEGLSAWLGGQSFDELGGLHYIKERFRRIIAGKRPIRLVVWIDEGEKDTEGAGQGHGGAQTDQLKVLLTEMVDRDYTGTILLGVPGSGKSVFAKALANEAEVLCIRLDLGALRGHGLVGQAEQTIRNAMKTVHAVGGDGGAFFVMTTNDISKLKPEFKARFHKGTWFFDIPQEEAAVAIWRIYLDKYGFGEMAYHANELAAAHPNWVGREIEACVRTAFDEDMTMEEAAATIIPVAVSARADIEFLRTEADGKYLSPDVAGPYRRPSAGLDSETNGRRKFAGVQED